MVILFKKYRMKKQQKKSLKANIQNNFDKIYKKNIIIKLININI